MLSDDEIIERGGTQDDIDAYAHDVGGACGAIHGGTCDYCGLTGEKAMTSKLLSEEELYDKLEEAVFKAANYEYNRDWDSMTATLAKFVELIESQKKAFAKMVVDIDTDVDIPEALKKIYSDGYSNGYNDRTYENSYNSVDFRMAEAIAPAVAKVRSRYDKQLKALEEV